MSQNNHFLHPGQSINEQGHLCIGGIDCTDLAKEYGTPLYVLDADQVRANCRKYVDAVNKYLPQGSLAIYASKALSFKRIYPLVQSEGMGADVVSSGEIYTARSSGFDMSKVFFHGNCKTVFDISFAMEQGVGCFVADNLTELENIDRIARERGIVQSVQLRLTPGIDPHTFDAVNTGKVDSKFGVPIETGQAMELALMIPSFKNIELTGFHCHIGSQISTAQPFIDAIDIMLSFIKEFKEKTGLEPGVLNLGGGFAVPYVKGDENCDIDGNVRLIAEHLKMRTKELSLNMPRIMFEPGRAIVAAAGTTLYNVENVKTINGYKSYTTIDGGMADNPRYALYGSQYTVLLANRAAEECDFECDVVGRCCESGDIIQEKVMLPRHNVNDTVAVLVTGAYNYSMASNYNALCKPALVMVSNAKAELAIARESFEHLTACQL
ncbi:MAG: diaminopimelate decarboxylase [Oscillospiraceae bacterium]|nr:diaminopimelate decarboxylase [Oscillospiraceae bacterium]